MSGSMRDEWPISAPAMNDAVIATSAAVARGLDRQLALATLDFFIPDNLRLTEQERASMNAMLHGLIDQIADGIRARLPADLAGRCLPRASDLVPALTDAGLLQLQPLVGAMRRQAEAQRMALTADTAVSTLQRWTASPDGKVAAAAMALIAGRGRRRDRFGRYAVDLVDIASDVREQLVMAIAAALCTPVGIDHHGKMAEAARGYLKEAPEGPSLEKLEETLADALGEEGRRAEGVLAALGRDGELPMLASILALEARIPAKAAWYLLVGGEGLSPLLLRLAGTKREEAAKFFAQVGGVQLPGDPALLIDAFDALPSEEVEARRHDLSLPPEYRAALSKLMSNG